MSISIEQEMYDAVKQLIEQRYPTGWGGSRGNPGRRRNNLYECSPRLYK